MIELLRALFFIGLGIAIGSNAGFALSALVVRKGADVWNVLQLLIAPLIVIGIWFGVYA